MKEVEPRVESADESKKSIKAAIVRIRQSMSKLSMYVRQFSEIDADGLDTITVHVSELNDYLNRDSIKGTQLYEKVRSILELFVNLDHSARIIESIVRAETVIVSINSEAKLILSKEPRIDRLEGFRPRFKSWTVDGMRDELSAEFQLRFPVFLGRRVKTKRIGKGFSIHIENVPDSPVDIKVVLETLKENAKQFLSMALLDAPVTFMYSVSAFWTKSRIDCTIALPRDEKDLSH
ncbi:MAG: hypothetical protein RTU30_02345 [Candidatus Thorarchaeota archaeon]